MSSSQQPTRSFSLPARLWSFRYAGRGVWILASTQPNARVHSAATLCAVGLAFALDVSRTEWCALVGAIIAVWSAEALNTAIEFLCDVASPDFHPLVEKAKDVAAGAVLICSLGAVTIGLLVFGPALQALLRSLL